jgi:hypothetical protein
MSTETLVRTRAYQIWEAEGRPHGRDAEHWFRALEEIGAPTMTTPEPKSPARRAAKNATSPATKFKAPARKRAPKK